MNWLKKAAIGIAMFAAATAARADGSLQIVDVPSPALAKAELAPAVVQKAAVYLPPSYDGSAKRYPVVYFLPGYGTQLESFMRRFDLKAVMDRLIAAGKTREMIVVVTSGYTPLGGGFYVNSPVNGNWEDYTVKDLVSHIDGHYRTLASVQSRGLAGHSMGGFGALNLAMRHPDVFGAVYSMSPGVATPGGLPTHPAFNETPRAAAIAIQEAIAPLDRPAALAELVTRANSLEGPPAPARFALAYGLTFAPKPDARLLVYPYPSDSKRIWAQYDTGFGNWAGKLKSYGANLKKLKAITIDVGDHDYYVFIREGCAYLNKLLNAAGIRHTYQVYPGDHSDKVSERLENNVLPSMSEVLTSNP